MSAMTSTRASPSNLDWYTTSASKLGENGVLPSLPRRAVCTCKWAGKRQNSISQVMLVEGISIPKCLGMLVFPSRWRGPFRKATRTMLGHAAIASLARLVAQQVKEARVRGQAPNVQPATKLLQLAWELDPHCAGALGCTGPHCIAAVLASNLSYQGKA